MFTLWVRAGTDREEQTISRHRPDDNRSRPDNPAAPADNRPADGLARPLFSEEARCPCGAHAEATGLCAKCRARAAWAQRHAHCDRLDPEDGPRRRRRSGTRSAKPRRPESDRPRQRWPRGRRPER
ncbi:MAG: hypothetical protein ACRDRY_21355 [Pseudonocardiaceae bacterium]